MDPSQTSKVNGIVRKKKEEKRNRAGPGASGATDSGSGNIDFTLRGKRGTRNKIHPKNWGYTTYLDKVFGMVHFLIYTPVFIIVRRTTFIFTSTRSSAWYN